MRKVAITMYCPMENNTKIMINNGMCFGVDLFNNITHYFFDMNSDVKSLEEQLKKFDKIYISMYSMTELKIVTPILDKRWVIGGPIVTTLNKYKYNLPCETTDKTIADYLGVSYRPVEFSKYFENIMIPFKNKVGEITLSIGGKCYWGKCKFCNFVSKREMIYGKDIERIIEQANELKHTYTINTAVPAVEPKQLRTILQCERRNKYNLFLIPSKEITNVLKEFDNNEMKGIIAIMGLEALSINNRSLFNKNTKDEDILEFIEHVIRLGGDLDMTMMTNYFNTIYDDVLKSKDFLKKMEKIIPPERVICFIWNDGIYTRWPLHQRKFLEQSTDYPIIQENDWFLKYLKVEVPENSDTAKYNKIIKQMIQTSKLCTDPNEIPNNILDQEMNI